MACETRQKRGICTHAQCPFPSETEHGYECVEINFASSLCETGHGCLKKCPNSYTDADVKTCPECQGKFMEENVCGTCGDFGVVRK